MIRDQAAASAASRPTRWTRSPTSIEQYAPLNKGHITTRQNIQIHHIPLRDADRGAPHPRASRAVLEPRGLRQHRAQRDRRPVGRRLRGRALRPHAVRGAFVRYFVRHPTTPADAAQGQDAPSRRRTTTARSRGIHDLGFIPRVRDGVKGVEMRVGGGTSIMPRVAPDALRLRRGRQRRLPEGLRGRPADLRPPGLAARQPRPRPPQGPRRQGRHRRVPQDGRRGARRATGSPSATSTPTPLLFVARRGGARPGGARVPTRVAERRQPRVRALRRVERRRPAPGGLQRRRGARSPAAT